jgi:protein TonB
MQSPFYLLAALLLSGTTAHAQKKTKPVAATSTKLEQGSFSPEGKRVGKWNFYNRKKELELSINYDSSRIVFTQADTSRYLVRVGEEWQLQRLARVPRFMGSSDERLFTLQKSLRYPFAAMSARQQGTVVLAYTVDPSGHTSEYAIEQSGGKYLNEEVLRAVQLLPDNWIPAIYQGRPTATRFYLTVNFKFLSESEAQQRPSTSVQGSTANAAGVVAPVPRFKQEIMVMGFAR